MNSFIVLRKYAVPLIPVSRGNLELSLLDGGNLTFEYPNLHLPAVYSGDTSPLMERKWVHALWSDRLDSCRDLQTQAISHSFHNAFSY